MEHSSYAAAPSGSTTSWNSTTRADSEVETTTGLHYSSYTLYALSLSLDYYLLPAIFLLGVFGNVMTILIMKRMKTGDSTINIFFTAVAVVDLSQLFLRTLIEWAISAFHFSVFDTQDVVCKLAVWGVTAGSTISSWFLVGMTVQRAVSVVWPHRVHSLCTRWTVRVLVIGVAVFCLLLYSHYVFGFRTVYHPALEAWMCTLPADDQTYVYFTKYIFVYVDLTIYSLLPFLVLTAANSVLVWKLTQSVKAAGRVLSPGDADQVKTREKAASSVTLTVIVVSMAFLVLTLPGSIEYILNYYEVRLYGTSGFQQAVKIFISKVCGLFTNTNHAINFYLYCLTGRRFREEFIKILCCGRSTGRQGAFQ